MEEVGVGGGDGQEGLGLRVCECLTQARKDKSRETGKKDGDVKSTVQRLEKEQHGAGTYA